MVARRLNGSRRAVSDGLPGSCGRMSGTRWRSGASSSRCWRRRRGTGRCPQADRDVPRAHTAVHCGVGIVGHRDRLGRGRRRSDRARGGVVAWPAALITVFAFQRNVNGIGWRLGKPRTGCRWWSARSFTASSWLVGLGGLRGDVPGAARTLVVITPGLLGGIFLALGEEIGWRGLLVPQLARLTTFTKTALLSGGIQAVWHWPFVLFAGFSSAADRGTPSAS
jgi:Type II CAAX prenyl endopeptidase Rce1-like